MATIASDISDAAYGIYLGTDWGHNQVAAYSNETHVLHYAAMRAKTRSPKSRKDR